MEAVIYLTVFLWANWWQLAKTPCPAAFISYKLRTLGTASP